MNHRCFLPADILLPDFSVTDGEKWSCVACDQYTSDQAYWEAADHFVGDAPSALRLILPEAYLSETETRKPAILSAMEAYRRTVLVMHPNSMILVERTQSDGRVRRGLVGQIDLEDYDFHDSATCLIRSTEKTVPERIPARTAVRRDATLDLPHVMLLVDDRNRTVLEPLFSGKAHLEKAYDHDLMQGGGHLTGYFLGDEDIARVNAALDALVEAQTADDRTASPLLFAVGDGNHSLAAAKTCYEELKKELGETEARCHPARYALVEIVNIYDEALEFEPIYRVMFGVNPDKVMQAFRTYAEKLDGHAAPQRIEWHTAGQEGIFTVSHPVSSLCVGTVQQFLNAYMETPEAEGVTVDYIHDRESILKLVGTRSDAVAFLFDGMGKEELFPSVMADGSLPRKTFSMGHAADKRFYTEARLLK